MLFYGHLCVVFFYYFSFSKKCAPNVHQTKEKWKKTELRREKKNAANPRVYGISSKSMRLDLNQRPLRPERSALPN